MPAGTDIPESRAPWTIDTARAVLLIHDMQKYFVRFFREDASPVVDLIHNIGLIRKHCVAAGIPVVYTAQPGNMSPGQRGLLKDFWGPGMAVEPEERDIVDALRPAEDDLVLTKWRYSALHRTDLLGYLDRSGRSQLIVCGVYARIGCLMTAAEAFANDVETFLVADAVADFSLDHHRMALEYAAELCAAVPTTEMVLTSINQ